MALTEELPIPDKAAVIAARNVRRYVPTQSGEFQLAETPNAGSNRWELRFDTHQLVMESPVRLTTPSADAWTLLVSRMNDEQLPRHILPPGDPLDGDMAGTHTLMEHFVAIRTEDPEVAALTATHLAARRTLASNIRLAAKLLFFGGIEDRELRHHLQYTPAHRERMEELASLGLLDLSRTRGSLITTLGIALIKEGMDFGWHKEPRERTGPRDLFSDLVRV